MKANTSTHMPAKRLKDRARGAHIFEDYTWAKRVPHEKDRNRWPVSGTPGWVRAMNNVDPEDETDGSDLSFFEGPVHIENPTHYFGKVNYCQRLPKAIYFNDFLWFQSNNGSDISTDFVDHQIMLGEAGEHNSGNIIIGYAIESSTTVGVYPNEFQSIVIDPNFIGGDIIMFIYNPSVKEYPHFALGDVGTPFIDAPNGTWFLDNLTSISNIVDKFRSLRIVMYLDKAAFRGFSLQIFPIPFPPGATDEGFAFDGTYPDLAAWDSAFTSYQGEAAGLGVDFIYGGTIDTGHDEEKVISLNTGSILATFPSTRNYTPIFNAIDAEARDFFGF